MGSATDVNSDAERSAGRETTSYVVMPAEIDICSAGEAAGELDAAIVPGVRVIVVDMTSTTFCDTSGLRVLAHAHQRARAQGAELRLVTAAPQVLRVLEVTALDTVLSVFPRVNDALAVAPGESGPG